MPFLDLRRSKGKRRKQKEICPFVPHNVSAQKDSASGAAAVWEIKANLLNRVLINLIINAQ